MDGCAPAIWGSLSEAGDLSLRRRIKELINRGGEKISPERVEGVLAGHPNVLEVAVFGVPDKMYGETVAAVVVPRVSARTDAGGAGRVLPRAVGGLQGAGRASGRSARYRTPRKAHSTDVPWPSNSAAGHDITARTRLAPTPCSSLGRRRIPASVRSGRTNG